ncbi:MAG: calcium-binding protein [Burkholderiaceae bacterium]
MAITVTLSEEQTDYLNSLNTAERYPDAYRYLRDIAKKANTSSATVEQRQQLEILTTWLDRAASINANDGSFTSEFVRGATEQFGALENIIISDEDFQRASNKLADAVIQKVIEGSGIPTAEEIILLDVNKAVSELKIDPWGWAGTIGDVLPTNVGGLGMNFVSLPTTDARAMGEAYAKAIAANGYGVGRWMTSQLPNPFSGAADLANLGGDYDQLGNFITSLQNQFQVAKSRIDPLILDLDGDGIETISTSAGIHFDHDGNYFAETTGWVGKDDGLLVWDKNGNGAIDNGGELFGNNTLLNNGSKAANGFAALADLDSNLDGKLDASDTAYTQLRLWKDSDSNAELTDGELLRLETAGVRSIAVNYTEQNITDAQGNQHLQAGTFTRIDGTTGAVGDVWFAADRARSIAQDDIAISDDIAALPDLAGFGNVRSLHQAMAHDQSGKLKALVQTLVTEKDVAKVNACMQDLLFMWSDSIGYDPSSRGSYFPDARKLYTLEAFLGEKFGQGAANNNLGLQASSALIVAFDNLSDFIVGKFIEKTICKSLYDSIGLSWDTSAATFKIDVTATCNTLQTAYELDENNTFALINAFGNSLISNGNFGKATLKAIRQQGDMSSSGFLFTLANIGLNLVAGNNENNQLIAVAQKENKILGMGGDDSIRGGDLIDVIVGGMGNDSLFGGLGNDHYLISKGDGADQIADSDSTVGNLDIVTFLDVDSNELTALQRIGDDLVLRYTSNDQLTISKYFDSAYYRIEQFAFADGVKWDDALIKTRVMTTGTANADSIIGYDDGSNRIAGIDGNDYLRGGAKDDQIDGGNGNDTLVGGTGNDILLGGDGDDTLYGSDGDDLLDAGMGSDVMDGGSGNDTYQIRGGGNDRISEGGGLDIVQLIDVASTDIKGIQRFRDDLIFSYGISDQLTISNYFAYTNYRIEQFNFADGVSLDDAAIKARVMTVGTAGTDTIKGYDDGSNRIAGQDGNDYLNGGSKDDQIDGGNGNDYLYGYGDNDTLTGGNGNDTLVDAAGNDILLGGDGDDALSGGDGDDLLDAGMGSDVVDGGSGNDTYLIRGGGNDRLSEGGGFDTVQLIDVASTDIKGIQRFRDDLIFSYGISDQLTISNFFAYTNYRIEQFNFADGVNWDDAAIKAWVMTVGTAGTDTINGYNEGSNRIFGFDGDDTIAGGAKDDVLDGGNGRDSLNGYAGNDVLLGQAGVDYLSDSAGNNLFDGGADNDVLIGGSGNEFFFGGTGDDVITPGSGADILAFNLGDGNDTIVASSGKDNTLSFGKGINAVDLRLSKSGNDLRINTSATDKVTLKDWYASTDKQSVATIEFLSKETQAQMADATSSVPAPQFEQYAFASLDRDFEQSLMESPWSTETAFSRPALDRSLTSRAATGFGGELAFQYAAFGGLSTMPVSAAQSQLTNPQFGLQSQPLQTSTMLGSSSQSVKLF